MSEIEELRREIAALRDELDGMRNVVRAQARERMVIESYLEALTSTRDWRPWEKRLNRWLPLWAILHPWRMLYRQPFSVWAKDEYERLFKGER